MILHKAETVSTNADLLGLARADAAEGTWLYADTQSGGRGRQGRRWVSPPGNLYASGLVRLRADDPPAPTLALVAGVAVWDVVADLCSREGGGLKPKANKPLCDDFGVTSEFPLSRENSNDPGVSLKWPNDLLANSGKLAGILLEREGDAVVIGVGLNLAHHPDLPDRPATSLAALGHAPPTPAEAVAALVERTAHWLDIWRTQGLAAIVGIWMTRAHPIGTSLSVDCGNATRLNGSFAGLDSTGGLILRLADGAESVIHAGDVVL
jgi:BirA family biotin operon repressor/biotin-[acetyl-CoA-carboxylase] ligase